MSEENAYLHDEEVPTSDPEEAEAIRVELPGYWEKASLELSTNRLFLLGGTRPLQGTRSSSIIGHSNGAISDAGDDSSPPRKRMRVSRSVENTPERQQMFERILRDIQSSPLEPIQLPSSKRVSSPEANSAPRLSLSIIPPNTQLSQSLPTPVSTEPSSFPQLLSPLNFDVKPEEEDFSMLPGSQLLPMEVASSDPEEIELEASPVRSSMAQHLFTPPRSQDSPRISGPQGISTPLQSRHNSPSVTASPLTPIHSPGGVSSSQHGSDPEVIDSPSNEVHVNENPDDILQGPPTEHDYQAGKYKLRERRAQQKHPYLYDYAQYKRQLRNNPDAIIHVRPAAGRDRHRARSKEADPGSSDQEVDPSQFEPEESDEERPRRHRSSSTNAHDSAHRKSTSAAPEAQKDTWQPKAFDVEFSDDDDDDDLLLQPPSTDPPEVEETQKYPHHHKRFPMLVKALQKKKPRSPSPRSELNENSSTRRSVSRTISQRRIESSDEEMPAAGSQRRSKSRSFSRQLGSDDWGLASLGHIDADSSADDMPPTSPRGSSSSVDGFAEYTQQSAIEDEWMGQDVQLPADIRQDVREIARNWPHGPAGEGASQTNPISISDDESPDDDADEEDASVTESDDEPDVRNIKGQKLLERMYPKAMVRKMLEGGPRRKTSSRQQKHHLEEGGPIRPGQVRVRRRSTPLGDAEIRGDSESDEEPPVEDNHILDLHVAPVPRRSRSPTAFRRSLSAAWSQRSGSVALRPSSSPPARLWSPGPAALQESYNSPTPEFAPNHRTVIEIDDDDFSSESEADEVYDAVDDEARQQWNEQGHNTKTKPGFEGSLIDYMLSRPGVKKRKKRTNKKSGRRQGIRHRRSSSGTPRVVTRSAKGSGHQRQTLLTVSRHERRPTRAADVDSGSDQELAPPIPYHRPGEEVQQEFAHDVSLVPKTSKQKDRRRNAVGVYTFSSNGKVITSGRTHAQAHTIHAEVEWHSPAQKRTIKPSSRMGPPAVPMRRQHRLQEPTRSLTRISDYFPKADEPSDQSKSLPVLDLSYDIGRSPAVQTPPPQPKPILELAIQFARDDNAQFYTPKLQSGIAFPTKSDLTEGRLLALTSSAASDFVSTPPLSVYFKETRLDPSMPIASFMDTITTALSDLIDALSLDSVEISADDYEDWHRAFRNTGPYITWYLSRDFEAYHKALNDFLVYVVPRIYKLVDGYHALRSDAGYVNLLVLDLQWFAIESIFRIRREDPIDLRPKELDPITVTAHLVLLVNHLLVFDASDPLRTVQGSADGPPLPLRIGELWVSLIHLTQEWEQLRRAGSLWDVLLRVLQDFNPANLGKAWHTKSEGIWRAIFSLCAWSQFSRSGITTRKPSLPADWRMVELALRYVDFPEQFSRREEEEWQHYIRLLISRCLRLHREWEWDFGESLDTNVLKIVRKFLTCFKSRSFSNFSQDKTDYPDFLKAKSINFDQIDEHKGNAYTLFLKLIMLVARGKTSVHVKKLLSMTAPVGSVGLLQPLSHSKLSTIHNRLTFTAVAIYLDSDDCKNLVNRARRYVEIDGMAHLVCRSLVRGIQYIGTALRNKDCSLQDVADWLNDIVAELTKQFVDRGYPAKVGQGLDRDGNNMAMTTQIPLGCFRHIITVQPWKSAWYPDPVLLADDCIIRMCSPETRLATLDGCAQEVQALLMSFLDMKDKPLPSRLTLAGQSEESQESQDDYGSFDYDDPALLAALGDNDESNLRQERDREVVNRLQPVMSIIARMLCERVATSRPSRTLLGCVRCWAACASAVVRSGQKPWSFFARTAELFWQSANPHLQLKLRVILRLTALQHNASIYEEDKQEFIRIMLQCIVDPTVTDSEDYIACVLWNDGLRHPIFDGVPFERAHGREKLVLSKQELEADRTAMVDCIIQNISARLDRQAEGEPSLTVENEAHVDILCSMLATMKAALPTIMRKPDNVEDLEFYRRIYQALSSSHALEQYPTIRTIATWLHDTLPPTTT